MLGLQELQYIRCQGNRRCSSGHCGNRRYSSGHCVDGRYSSGCCIDGRYSSGCCVDGHVIIFTYVVYRRIRHTACMWACRHTSLTWNTIWAHRRSSWAMNSNWSYSVAKWRFCPRWTEWQVSLIGLRCLLLKISPPPFQISPLSLLFCRYLLYYCYFSADISSLSLLFCCRYLLYYCYFSVDISSIIIIWLQISPLSL